MTGLVLGSTLCQFYNAKLVDKEVDAKILQLASNFSNAKDDENKGRLDEVIKVVIVRLMVRRL